jgi:predicted acyl esterase
MMRSEEADGMHIDWDVPIEMDDGIVLGADVFRPIQPGRYPVIMTCGPYSKGLAFAEGYPAAWQALVTDHPEVVEGTSTRYANWETADPERWVPDGYVVIRVDSRGTGVSPGFIDPFSSRETKDYYDCIEWAGVQPWSNGKIGLLGVSYYAMNQWQVAALRPPHLAAICPFEGASDLYRDGVRHGGMLTTFWTSWYPLQVTNVQHGLGKNGRRSAVTGEPITGDDELTPEEMSRNRIDIRADQLAHPLFDDFFASRVPDLSQIEVPVLSCGNWGGQGLHLRGNTEGFLGAGSKQKWLEMHGLEHWTEFYTDYGLDLEKRFMGHFLKGEDNGWDRQPAVMLNVRKVDGFTHRTETEWPIAGTAWTKIHLDARGGTLGGAVPKNNSDSTFTATKEEVHFTTAAFEEETELTGPLAARLFVSSSTTDADLFLTLRLFSPDEKEILFVGAVEPNAPVTQGWLRASHRKLDTVRSVPWRPVHAHDELQPVEPGQIYPLDIEIWPTSIVVPVGYRLQLTVSGHDYDNGLPSPLPQLYGIEQRGSSVWQHKDPADTPAEVFAGSTTIYTGEDHDSWLLLPIISGAIPRPLDQIND